MSKSLPLVVLSCVMALPAISQAREVTLTTDLNSYRGKDAYLAFYVTDAQGQYSGTLWVAGKSSKYYRHLRDWYRAGGGQRSEIQGITGASVGSGRSLTVRLNLAEALFNAGYEVHIDAAVEDQRESPNDVVLSLDDSGNGRTVAGRRYVKSARVDF